MLATAHKKGLTVYYQLFEYYVFFVGLGGTTLKDT